MTHNYGLSQTVQVQKKQCYAAVIFGWWNKCNVHATVVILKLKSGEQWSCGRWRTRSGSIYKVADVYELTFQTKSRWLFFNKEALNLTQSNNRLTTIFWR